MRLLLVVSAVLFACGEFTEKMIVQRGPGALPEHFLKGKFTGIRLILDRAGNLRETARVLRTCESRDNLKGECRDAIQYFYATDPKKRNKTNVLSWSAEYREGKRTRFQIRDSFGSLSGEAIGPVVVLSGQKTIPHAPGKRAKTSARFYMLPGHGSPISEIEIYKSWGMRVGEIRTLWTRGGH